MGHATDHVRSVLLVDDQPEVRTALRHILSRAGRYAIAEASSVADALDLIERDPPNAVILDISMPGGPGFTLIPALRSMSEGTKVLVLSTHAEMGEEIRAMGADAFLPKSSSPRTVLSTLAGILSE